MGLRLRKQMEVDTRGAGSLACTRGCLHSPPPTPPHCLVGSASMAWRLDLGGPLTFVLIKNKVVLTSQISPMQTTRKFMKQKVKIAPTPFSPYPLSRGNYCQ